MAALAIAAATALDFASGAAIAVVDASAHIVQAALLVAACMTEELEEPGRIVAEAVAQAVQAAQNELEPGAVVAAVRFDHVLGEVVEVAVDALEGIVAAAVRIDAASAAETHHSDQTEAAIGEAVVALFVPLGSPAHRS
jgi:hypothetical protein